MDAKQLQAIKQFIGSKPFIIGASALVSMLVVVILLFTMLIPALADSGALQEEVAVSNRELDAVQQLADPNYLDEGLLTGFIERIPTAWNKENLMMDLHDMLDRSKVELISYHPMQQEDARKDKQTGASGDGQEAQAAIIAEHTFTINVAGYMNHVLQLMNELQSNQRFIMIDQFVIHKQQEPDYDLFKSVVNAQFTCMYFDSKQVSDEFRDVLRTLHIGEE